MAALSPVFLPRLRHGHILLLLIQTLFCTSCLQAQPPGVNTTPRAAKTKQTNHVSQKAVRRTNQAAQTPVAAPEAPRETVAETWPVLTGRRIEARGGDDLQQIINQAKPGDEIILPAGAVYRGNFVLPAHAGPQWIVIRGSTLDRFPAGTRIRPAGLAGQMPRIESPNDAPAIRAAPLARLWRLAGLEIAAAQESRRNFGLVWFGDGTEKTYDQLTGDLILDRVYLHGHPQCDCVRGVSVNGSRQAVLDSHLSEFHSLAQDSQAILGVNGPGPFLIRNNYLEASGENIMFGGADPALQFRMRVRPGATTTTAQLIDSPGLDVDTPLMFTVGGKTGQHSYTFIRSVEGDTVTFDALEQAPDPDSFAWAGVVPSDIEIRGNTFFKPLTWKAEHPSFQGTRWIVKNLFELKSAQRVLLEGNWLENSWPMAQVGIGLLITSTNQDGECPFCITQDVDFRHNVLLNTNWAIVVQGHQSATRPERQPANVNRLRFRNNLIYPSQRLLGIYNSAYNFTFEHNTAFATNNTLVTNYEDAIENRGILMRANIVERSVYGMGGGGKEGVAFLDRYFAPAVFQNNGIINTSRGTEQEFPNEYIKNVYGPTSLIVEGLDGVRFVRPLFTSREIEGFALQPGSPFAGAGAGGVNLGADITALRAALPSPLF